MKIIGKSPTQIKSSLEWRISKIKKRAKVFSVEATPTFVMKKYIENKSRGEHYPPVLMFHKVSDDMVSPMHVSTADLRKIISFFSDNSYRFLFEKEYCIVNDKAVLLTFDDGYTDNYTLLFPILKELDCKASINIISEKIDEQNDKMNREQIKEMFCSGLVDIECHTSSHCRLPECSDEELVHELCDSKVEIKNKTGIDCECIVYPYNFADDRVMSEAQKNYRLGFGNRYDFFSIARFSVENIHNERTMLENIYCCLKRQRL